VNLRLLRLVAYAFSSLGLLLAILTIVLGLDPTIRLAGVILATAGLVLFFRWSALKAKEGKDTRA
jgi:hypothetical protein